MRIAVIFAKWVPSLLCVACFCLASEAEQASPGYSQRRMRTLRYDTDQVYRLRGFVGYELDLEFESGEAFVGLGTGDVEGLSVAPQANHLFIKPKASNVRTNLTVLTTRRSYHFEYQVLPGNRPDPDDPELIFALRFSYPPPPAAATPGHDAVNEALRAPRAAPLNLDYWYCGSASLMPTAVFDDGVHTHVRFDPRAELPALFVRNDDGSESLLNFTVQDNEVVIHRVARQFALRRGRLTGCILNKGFDGSGRALSTGTVSPEVQRATRGARP